MIDFVIKHPDFIDEKGEVTPDFEGSYFINSNDYNFFLGDMIWQPINDKCGEWILISYLEGEEIALKKFKVYLPEE